MENEAHPLSPPPCVLPDPQTEAPPNIFSAKRDAPFLEPSNYLLKIPSQGLPRFPNGPLQRQTPFSRAFFYTFPSEPHSMLPNRVPMDREASSPEPMIYSFIYICHSPK